MTIPRREIDAELQIVFSCGCGNLGDYIALAVFPGAALHAVVCLLRGPEAETVVMFGDHDHVFGARGFDGAHPLFGIECGGVENLWISRAVAPFAIHEG